jgi:hypothetical protein
MAIKLTTKPNTDPVSGPWPFGKIRDDDGSGNGTEVDTNTYGDFHQFFESMMAYAVVVANDQPDNQTNGFQFLEAFQKAISKRIGTRQGGTGDLNNEIYAGVFNVGGAGGSLNRPVGFTEPGQLIVAGGADDVRQRIVEVTTGGEWTRYYNGSWSAWSLVKYPQKIVEIGDWNMDTTVTKDVDIGVAHTKVRAINVLIKSDADGFLQPLNFPDTTTQLPGGRVGNIFGTEVTLRRFDGGPFDASGFSSTGYNRGFIEITYAP